jgi:hypothetical protein
MLEISILIGPWPAGDLPVGRHWLWQARCGAAKGADRWYEAMDQK